MKKIIGVIACGLFLNAAAASSQVTDKEKVQMEKRIEKLIKKMTLEEKVGLLHGNSKFYVAGVERLGIPEWSLSDGPHGVRAEINRHDWAYAGWTNDSASYFPTGTAFAAAWNPELAYRRGEVLGEEARWRKKDVLLGPGVNIIRSPLCGRNFEYMSEDPYMNSVLAVAYIKGLQSRDVACSVKHFAVNNQETNRTTVDVECSERALREIYLPAFKAAVQEGGALTVMAAYNKFRGEFCAENNYLVRKILRNEWGFDGVYVTDWGAAHSTVPSMEAGLDLEMGTLIDKYEDWYYANPLIEAVKSGKIPMSLVDEKVGDVLRVMIKTNVLDPKKRFGPGSMNTKEHQQATYDAAAEAIVLLKNQNNLLPLDFSSIKSLAVIGDNATRKHSNGGLSSEIKAVYEVTPLEALRAKWGDKVDIRFAQGYEKLSTFVEGSNNGQSSGTFSSKTQESDALLKEAVEVARTSDVALLVCGLNHDYDTESFDRLNMDIPYGQVELIQEVVKANPRTIVVMIAGSPLNMAAVDICSPAIVWAWFNGMEGGNALVDVLSGKVNPSGKMPFTTPVSLDQSPAHALGNFPGRDLKVNYEEDILVGYRWFDTKGLPVVYPFGYGLSYTTFDYSNLNTDKETYDQADTIQATFTLTNTGDREGAEVAQLYVSDPVCSVMRPVKELKGFKKVFLKPGESRRITLDIPVSSLAFYSEAQSQFVVEPGEFILQLGASASDITQRISVEVK
ncbi:glycoside hydrolase family 3 C-terminal domain-containing protein [Parabacteroides distasonis]|uniref:glycoside hydrolase family 3 C-terminal domain-containing protein n=4 Tax=Parabacteroides distasonis TaxID=823 RepID=UPI0018981014|nr:glycoside hydrolase family 3 C-terminal domain-containing protein [Parabacteroides distasonis]MDB9050331.1 glycoside hydrolase family 3 C-terminal domain-containing protein [Parabacteroides distasonis]MDB9059602.1 glycoside hydrolase family 3 C-terminal domain-containing protein [Parabacteroides distasonis]MDB9088364.1 glycoside hydrolase family 3 C-terminal domain-containing protein [Parabacteroides distasonis]UVR95053.1 glycoside hydrolase family 3 C-terminal domain-containing protein [Par